MVDECTGAECTQEILITTCAYVCVFLVLALVQVEASGLSRHKVPSRVLTCRSV